MAPLAGAGVQAILIDLRDLTFLDSSGVHALLAAWRRAKVEKTEVGLQSN